ncbi:fungal-specific transcription factor domain-containing protein [Leptodontidium sp. MPI-SDFR-AT-0119]|nr:fungal-specific transcription factor domain-containing protein [Leptodontidium sp. MPI-SDFR-AT-0119]
MSDPQLPLPRKRVSQACQPCGLKKVKCDGTYPICTPCQYKQIDCTYGISKRSRARTSIGESPRPRPPPPTYHSQDDQPHKPAVQSPYNVLDNQTTRIPPRPAPSSVRNVSTELSSRLLQTYFNCLHPLWPMLYKPLYTSMDYGSPTDIMHPALVAAIFCIASCVDRPMQHAPNTIVQKYPEPGQFLQEALDILQQGSDGNKEPQMINALSPSITACQVLTILCLQQHGVAEYAQAAVFCSLAAGMAIDLRLHRQDESDDPIQVEVKSRLWWNLYVLDKMISSDMGKPVLLRAEETDCRYPSVSEADEFELMSAQAGGQHNSGQFRNTSIKLRTLSGLHSTIELSKIFERVSREIYGIVARKAIRENQAAGQAKRMELWAVLQEWEREMEASPLRLDLSKDLTSVPAAVTNYVINWHCTILLHRPFIARWSSNPASTDSPHPLDVCLEAANNICIVLEKYIDRLLGLPCDMVFSVFTAASTLLYHSKMSKEPTPETSRRLKLCIRWLSILGKSWKSAGARHQMLADMFDLPQELRTLNSSNPRTLRSPTPEGSHPSQKYPSGTATPAPAPISNGYHSSAMEQVPQIVNEDWGFLRDFGDASDEFFAFDVQLRGLLDGGFGLDGINNYAG